MSRGFDKYSNEEAYRVAYLIAGYIRGTLSTTEHNELDEWVAANDENMQLFERLTDEKNIEEAAKWIEGRKTNEALQGAKKKISFSKPGARVIWLRFLPYAVAASLIIVAALIFLKPFKGNNRDEIVSVSTNQDIAPGGNKAILVLANGNKVILDSAINGVLAKEGNTNITSDEGQVQYERKNAGTDQTLYNTITTPRGGQYSVTLSDGSKVWLNAGSSIYFPVVFGDKERTVTITGEAYFEIAPLYNKASQKIPFKVDIAGRGIVEVLGTHFNINAYNDEPVIRVTLAEGSVKVIKENTSVIIKPGQEAQINEQGDIKTLAVNLEESLAWKEGKFLFNDAPIENIMRQVVRWYDAEIVYENRSSDHFNADVSRDVPVSKLLHILELTNRVHFKIENKKIVVLK
jgi:ferric-dicitrate binding protein FerR (iron transport regulator)